MSTKQSAIEAAELAWAEHERNGFCMSKDGKRRLRAAILAWLEAIAEDGGRDAPGLVEQCMKAVLKSWKHAGVTCSPDLEASELASRAVLSVLLSRAKEQQG
jgi:hypothetical protein